MCNAQFHWSKNNCILIRMCSGTRNINSQQSVRRRKKCDQYKVYIHTYQALECDDKIKKHAKLCKNLKTGNIATRIQKKWNIEINQCIPFKYERQSRSVLTHLCAILYVLFPFSYAHTMPFVFLCVWYQQLNRKITNRLCRQQQPPHIRVQLRRRNIFYPSLWHYNRLQIHRNHEIYKIYRYIQNYCFTTLIYNSSCYV